MARRRRARSRAPPPARLGGALGSQGTRRPSQHRAGRSGGRPLGAPVRVPGRQGAASPARDRLPRRGRARASPLAPRRAGPDRGPAPPGRIEVALRVDVPARRAGGRSLSPGQGEAGARRVCGPRADRSPRCARAFGRVAGGSPHPPAPSPAKRGRGGGSAQGARRASRPWQAVRRCARGSRARRRTESAGGGRRGWARKGAARGEGARAGGGRAVRRHDVEGGGARLDRSCRCARACVAGGGAVDCRERGGGARCEGGDCGLRAEGRAPSPHPTACAPPPGPASPHRPASRPTGAPPCGPSR